MHILGIDPGSRIVGFASISSKVDNPYFLKDFKIEHVGVLRASLSESFVERIGALHLAMNELIEEIKPSVCVVESAFLGKNVQSALKLGQARGALMSAVARNNVRLIEVAPTFVKRTITGNGHAQKEEVSVALELLIGFKRGKLPFDASDALAIALAHGVGSRV